MKPTIRFHGIPAFVLLLAFAFNLQAFVSQKEMVKWSQDHPDAAPLISQLESVVPGKKPELIRAIMQQAWAQGFRQLVYIAVTEDTNNTMIMTAADTISEHSRDRESAEALLTALERADWIRHVGMEGQGYVTNQTKQVLEKSLCKVLGLNLEPAVEKRIPYDFLKTKVNEFKAAIQKEILIKGHEGLTSATAKPDKVAGNSSASANLSGSESNTGLGSLLVGASLCLLAASIFAFRRRMVRRVKKD